ncbi:MAG: DUF748 domain-containing protein [Opitutaceae bacterium]
MKASRRLRRWLIALVVCFVLVGVIGFFVLPPIVKSQAEKRLSAALGRQVTIGKVRLNPYVLSMTIENFDIREKDGQHSFLGWNRVYVNVDLLSSLVGDWVVSDVEVEGLHGVVVIRADGSFNFSDLLASLSRLASPSAPSAPPAKPMHPIRVDRLAVAQARAEFTDLTRPDPFHTVVGPLTFVLTNFRTAGSNGAPYHFEAVTESGEKLSWTGSLAVDPVASKGEFAVENLILKKYTPYFEEVFHGILTEGKLTVRGRYEAALKDTKITLKMSDGAVHLRDLRVSEIPAGPSVVELPKLDVTGIRADAIALKATVDSVALAGGHITVRRDANGMLNLLTMVQTAPVPGAASVAAPPMPLPDFKVGEVTVKDFKVTVTDNAAPRPAQLELNGLQVSLKNVTLANGAVMPLDASFSWAPRGTVHTAGTVTLKPEITADLKSEVNDFAILPLSPYVEKFVNARITGGAVTTTNTVHLALPAAIFAGDITVKKFGLVDALHNEKLAGYAALTLKDLKASTAPQLTVSLAEIDVTDPYARLVISAFDAKGGATVMDHPEAINFMTVMKNAAAPAVATTPTVTSAAVKSGQQTPPASTAAPRVTPAAALPQIEVGRVVIAGGDFSFTDRSVEPNVHLSLSQFGGTITGLSSANLAKAEVELKGMVDGAGPVAISGKLDPLGTARFVDLKIDFKNVDLLPLSPYTGKYAGYELVRGKLVVDSKVEIQGRKLDATNVVTLNQFTFGTATNSPDATGLPVRLGVALLKDADGKIVIDLPVQGNLDDPDFRVGKVVMRVLVNLLTKAATSPFSLIGSMFGGGGDELAFQEFTPGSSELLPAELPKLATLVKALTNRPALSLGIAGSFDAAADAYALKRQKFAEQVRRQIWEAKHATDPNIAPPDQLVISPEENAAMIKKLFNEKFPPGTQFGTPLPTAPLVAALPAPPPPGILKRVVNIITFKERREERAQKEQIAHAAADHDKAVEAAAEAGLPLDEMTGRLAEAVVINDDDLRALASARAMRVRDQLINVGHVAPDRLFLAQPKVDSKLNQGPRVFLTLQ